MIEFDFETVRTAEFGVGLDQGGGDGDDDGVFRRVPADDGVQDALLDMARATWETYHAGEDDAGVYQPGEKYGSVDRVYLPINHPNAAQLRLLHQADNIEEDAAALAHPLPVFAYYARFRDGRGRRLTAVRRASYFKGVLKRQLLWFIDNTMQIIEDNVFKLDTEFDVVIDANHVYILHPSGFEFVCRLKEQVLGAVAANVGALRGDLPFVDFDGIEEYASAHPQAARYIASIRAYENLARIDRDALQISCADTGVEVEEANGQLEVKAGHEMGFLEVLDRRRYRTELIVGEPERFRASSRSKLSN